MDRLSVPLASITENGVNVDETVSTAALRPEGALELPVPRVHVRGTLQRVSGEYLFRGAVAGTFVHPCDRCLAPAEVPFETTVLWSFEPGQAESDAEDAWDGETQDDRVSTYHFEGNEIDLAPLVWEEMSLAAPVKYLCREDCAGLCPQCGAKLNEGPCGCPSEQNMQNKGFAGLDTLLAQFEHKPPEE